MVEDSLFDSTWVLRKYNSSQIYTFELVEISDRAWNLRVFLKEKSNILSSCREPSRFQYVGCFFQIRHPSSPRRLDLITHALPCDIASNDECRTAAQATASMVAAALDRPIDIVRQIWYEVRTGR